MTPELKSSSQRALVDHECGGCNTGQCVQPSVSGNIDPTSSLASFPICDCKGTGFIGLNCEIPCSKNCLNGGKCIPASNEGGSEGGEEEGEESCSCSKAVVDGNPFAGLLCEYGATKSCMALGTESKHSFCTNGGECQDIVTDNEQHKDCICGKGYEGPHCEYLEGTAPASVVAASASAQASAAAKSGETYGTSSSESKSFSMASSDNMMVYGVIAVIAALIAVLVLAFLVRAKRNKTEAKRREREVREATEELSMIPTDDNMSKEDENEII